MKKIRKVGLIFIALITMIAMNACSYINSGTADDVCVALSEKYGESFVATKIGDRIDTDGAKVYVHPMDNESLVFSARINKDSGTVEDNYIRTIIANEFEEEIKSNIVSSDLPYELCVRLMCLDTSNETDTEISLESFAERYSLSGIIIYFPIKSVFVSDDAIRNIVSVFQKISTDSSISVSAMLYNISDEKFDSCIKDMSNCPDLTNTWFDSYGVQGTATVSVKEGTVTPDISEIVKCMVGE